MEDLNESTFLRVQYSLNNFFEMPYIISILLIL